MTRLVTFVDLDERARDDEVSVSARHEAVLSDGRHMLLLGDRGWAESGPANIWAYTSVDGVVNTARSVVGPDEPPAGRSHDEEAALHWRALTAVLRRQGVVIDASQLRLLPHDVLLSERLLARIREGHNADGS